MSIISKLFGSVKSLSETKATEEQTVQVKNEHECETHDKVETEKGDKPEQSGIINIYHLIVLDESGSMYTVKTQTVSGCNETLQTIRIMQQAQQTQRHFVSIYLFDTNNSRYIIRNAPIDSARDITDKDYQPNSLTPLYDALGHTLTELRQTIGPKNSLAYVTVITDGRENASREYSLSCVRALIDDMKQKHVVFSFIGANIDVDSYAKEFGIENRMQFKENAEGTLEMWRRERQSKMRSNSRLSACRAINIDGFVKEENSGRYYDEDINMARVSPPAITSLADNEVFVFGSNLAGRHMGGASRIAFEKFGARLGRGEGLQGRSYAIVTDGVSRGEMYDSILRFCEFAKKHPEFTFLVTAVGCGSAGYSAIDVAPVFAPCVGLDNVKLPESFWKYM